MRQDTLQSHAGYLGASTSGGQHKELANVETGRAASQRLPSYVDLRVLWSNSSSPAKEDYDRTTEPQDDYP